MLLVELKPPEVLLCYHMTTILHSELVPRACTFETVHLSISASYVCRPFEIGIKRLESWYIDMWS